MQTKNWYSCKVKVKKPDIDGIITAKVEAYMVEAESYTDAETTVNRIMAEEKVDGFYITGITKTNIAEVHPKYEEMPWFKVKLSMVAFDDESGKEKQSSFYMLIEAENVKECYSETKKIMKDSGTGYVIPSIVNQKVNEVYFLDRD